MRRVYDDSMIAKAVEGIDIGMQLLDCKSVCKYKWSDTRADVGLIKSYLSEYIGRNFKFGNTSHAYNIGNNNAIEIIYTGNPAEEQICGLLHLIDDMFGGVYVYVTDIDGNKLKRWGKVTEYGIRED